MLLLLHRQRVSVKRQRRLICRPLLLELLGLVLYRLLQLFYQVQDLLQC